VSDAPAIAVSAALTQRPAHGGHTWAILQYLLGFRRLGFRVLFIDRLEASMLSDGGAPIPVEASPNYTFLRGLMSRFGLDGNYALLTDGGRSCLGLDREAIVELAGRRCVLFNVMGYLDDEQLLAAFDQRVFVDIDPGFSQMWHQLGLHDAYTGHDQFVTVAENIGRPECAIPTCGLDWKTTRPPVVLSEWPLQSGAPPRFTSVVTWRGPNGPLQFEGTTFGLRAHEFRKFTALPWATGADFELVLDIDPADATDRDALVDSGWTVCAPQVTANPDAYRAYVQSSRAELMVAKNMYVKSRSGWFSDRSACYLASGRPVVAQDTGWAANHPARDGLLTFRTCDEAAEAVADVEARYDIHSSAARELACELFDSDRVLPDLLSAVGFN